MTKSKNTKRALLASILSMMLCTALLIGSTFAWFTDSVTSGRNQIVAGNLDVAMDYAVLNADGSFKEWKTVDSETSLFDENTLWEPGYTQVVYLKIRNVGSLSLNYKLSVNVENEHQGTRYNKETQSSEFFKLSDYLKFGAVTDWDGTTVYADRAAARAAIGEAGKLKNYSTTGSIKASEKDTDIKYVALVVYMPEEVGDEANHRSGSNEYIPWIDLGIKLEASQMMDENDSFSNDYDKNAFQNDTESGAFADLSKSEFNVASEADLLKFADLVNTGTDFTGKTITLADNIALTQANWSPIGTENAPFKGIFDGADKTISGLQITEDSNGLVGFFGKVTDAEIKNLTVNGNINLSSTNETEALIASGICAVSGKNVKITNCTNQVEIDASEITGSESLTVYIGGIVGAVETSTAFSNCQNTAALKASTNDIIDFNIVCGITAGAYMQEVTVDNCQNSGTLTGISTADLLMRA